MIMQGEDGEGEDGEYDEHTADQDEQEWNTASQSSEDSFPTRFTCTQPRSRRQIRARQGLQHSMARIGIDNSSMQATSSSLLSSDLPASYPATLRTGPVQQLASKAGQYSAAHHHEPLHELPANTIHESLRSAATVVPEDGLPALASIKTMPAKLVPSPLNGRSSAKSSGLCDAALAGILTSPMAAAYSFDEENFEEDLKSLLSVPDSIFKGNNTPTVGVIDWQPTPKSLSELFSPTAGFAPGYQLPVTSVYPPATGQYGYPPVCSQYDYPTRKGDVCHAQTVFQEVQATLAIPQQQQQQQHSYAQRSLYPVYKPPTRYGSAQQPPVSKRLKLSAPQEDMQAQAHSAAASQHHFATQKAPAYRYHSQQQASPISQFLQLAEAHAVSGEWAHRVHHHYGQPSLSLSTGGMVSAQPRGYLPDLNSIVAQLNQ